VVNIHLKGMTRRQLAASLACTALMPRAARAKPLRRFASMDYGLAETLICPGCPPIALVAAQDWGRWVVEPPLPESVVNLGTSREPNLELLQALKPDAILSTPYLAGIHHRLEAIAPVVSLPLYVPEGTPLALAEEAARKLALMIGAPEAGEALRVQEQACFDEARAQLAGRAHMPVFLVNLMDERHVRIYGAKGLFQDVLDRIGLRNAWTGATNYWGFATVGIEALQHDGEAQLVYLDPVPPGVLTSLARNPIWNALSFVKAGHVCGLPPALMFGCVPSAMRFARLMAERLPKLKEPG